MRTLYCYLVVAFFGSLLCCPANSIAEEGKVLRHIVMYKFKPETTPAQIQDVIDAFAGLPKKVDTIIGYEAGTNVSK